MRILIVTGNDADTKSMHQLTLAMIEKIKESSKGLEVLSIFADDQNLDGELKKADILISTSLAVLNSENSKNLKWVHITSAGTNKLPEFVKSSNILITNSSGVHPIPISEHVFAFMLMLSRKINLAHRFAIEKKGWVRNYGIYQPGEIFGKKLLIVGMGRIGERIAEIGRAFGMEVAGVVRDLNKKRDVKVKLYEIKDLKTAVKDADFIVNALPGTSYTKGIFDLKLFKRFKSSAYFINIGRGTSVVEEDLVQALKMKIIAGAGLDVFEIEPLPESSELWDLENGIITPHYSGWTPKYTDRVIDIFIENLKAYFKKETMPNLVNKELGY